MKKLLFLFFMFFPVILIGQIPGTTLSPGELVILNTNADGKDGFSFMSLVDLDEDTEIHFTDIGWNSNTGAFRTTNDGGTYIGSVNSEGYGMCTYTVPAGGLSAGVVISQEQVTDAGGNNMTNGTNSDFLKYGSHTTAYLLISVLRGDQILVFQNTKDNPSFIWAHSYKKMVDYEEIYDWTSNGGGTDYNSDLPPGLTNSTNAIVVPHTVDTDYDNGWYSGATTSASADDWRARVVDTLNWTYTDDTVDGDGDPNFFTHAGNSYTVSTPAVAATVTTQAVTNITSTTATGNGNITSLGSPNPTTHGLCWNTSGVPTTSDSNTDSGEASSTGAFTGSLSSLDPGTTYYVRAYATNSAGTSYGNEVSFKTSKQWTGSSSTVWGTTGNWSSGSVPTSSENVVIPNVTNDPVIGSSATCNDLTLEGSASLTISTAGDLTVTGNYSNSGTVTIKSGSSGTGSLIHNTASITATIERYITADEWHIVGTSVVGQSINSLLTNGSNSIALNGGDYGVTVYNETSDSWDSYYTSSTTGNFVHGKGYLFRRQTSDGIVSFTGSMVATDINYSVTNNNYGWNCVSNPFISAIGVTSNATSTENFLSENASLIDDSYEALYVWDPGAGDYVIVNNAGGGTWATDYLQTGQGFFVKTASAGQVTFSPEMRAHQTSQTFKSGGLPWPGIIVRASSADSNSSTSILFNDNMTNGLDIGYDAGAFKTNAGISLYTKLLVDNGVDFGMQCLPLSSIEDVEIPIGLEAPEVGKITIKISANNLPYGLKPILEDKSQGTKTLFAETTDHYEATIDKNGYGRFFLSFDKNATAVGDLYNDKQFTAYCQNNKIVINGKIGENALLSIYDITGRQLATHQLNNSNVNTIDVPSELSGVYLLRIVEGNSVAVLKVVVKN